MTIADNNEKWFEAMRKIDPIKALIEAAKRASVAYRSPKSMGQDTLDAMRDLDSAIAAAEARPDAAPAHATPSPTRNR